VNQFHRLSRFILHPYNSAPVSTTTLVYMANPKHTIHVGIAVTGLVLGGLLSVLLGDPSIVAVFAGGSMSALGYWLGAAAQRRHG
jgi:hypothetical protein